MNNHEKRNEINKINLMNESNDEFDDWTFLIDYWFIIIVCTTDLWCVWYCCIMLSVVLLTVCIKCVIFDDYECHFVNISFSPFFRINKFCFFESMMSFVVSYDFKSREKWENGKFLDFWIVSFAIYSNSSFILLIKVFSFMQKI